MIDALGEIGGFMKMMFSFFSLICSIFVDILYEKELTNNLFTFNIQKKLITVQKEKNSIFIIKKENNIQKSPEVNIFSNTKKEINKRKENKDKSIETDLTFKNDHSEVNSIKKESKIDNIDIQPIRDGFEDLNRISVDSIIIYQNYVKPMMEIMI